MKTVDKTGLQLLQAAEYIREHGWCQEKMETMTGSVCVLGALGLVAPYKYEDALARMRKYIKAEFGVARWNDQVGRTQEEVITALQSAAFSE